MPKKGRGADLHIHSNFSDGTLSPAQIAEMAARAALSAISITDHDTVEGISASVVACEMNGLRFIPGVELSADDEHGREIHIAGLFVDFEDENLLGELARLREGRRKRIHGMCERLQELNIPITSEEVFQIAGDASPGRPHLAHALLRAGYVASVPEAFWKYIGADGPAYVEREKLSAREGIQLLKRARAVTILCHPGYLSPFGEDEARNLKDLGIDAIEAYSPYHDPSEVEAYLRLAKKFSLGVSGGSDFHGFRRDEAPIGSVRLPEEHLEDLLRRTCPESRYDLGSKE